MSKAANTIIAIVILVGLVILFAKKIDGPAVGVCKNEVEKIKTFKEQKRPFFVKDCN